ncbi:hypothetical protein FXO38_07015 [Capsicum annuum]|uniref:HMA domain-containing protein n=1 Tax=Capsicum annuum TaxID=4072 RepID=A0A1U8ECI1_CAPAN|nr:heavy metal-associated isoprenylated plant protein 29-like [Capsicum annuum]KAF3670539.1 hypothetical protein FXO38_07015 [Capsicum annuum]PHT70973.1 hypothetical protein T459_26077 [Capsicum annuum]
MKTITTGVFQQDLHGEEHAREVEQFIRQFKGVKDVNADYNTGKIMVTGSIANISRLRKIVERTTNQKAELLTYEHKLDDGSSSGEDKKSKKAVRVRYGSSLFGCFKPKVVGRGHGRHPHHGHNHGHTSDSSSDHNDVHTCGIDFSASSEE